MKINRFLVAAFAVAFLFTSSVFAAASTSEGTWSWMQPGRDADISVSLKIETKAGKLTGSLTNPNQTVEVTELVVKDSEISFSVANRRSATKYAGKIAGDTITGSIEIPPGRNGGEARKVDWKAKRGAPAAK